MEIKFTHHAVRRMSERSISEEEVYEVFESPILVVEKKSSLVIGHTTQGRILTLVLDLSQKRLLTLWPSSHQEKRLYRDKIERSLK